MDTIQKQSNTFRNTRGYGERPHFFFFFFNNFINDCRDASCLALTCRVLYNSSYSLASVITETALGYTWGFSILPDSHSHSHAFTVRSCSLFCIALLFNRTCRIKMTGVNLAGILTPVPKSHEYCWPGHHGTLSAPLQLTHELELSTDKDKEESGDLVSVWNCQSFCRSWGIPSWMPPLPCLFIHHS